MFLKNFEITVVSLPHREELVAEIYYQNQQWVEISQETGELIIQFYPHPRQKYWEFPLEQALQALEQAKKKMLDLGGRRE